VRGSSDGTRRTPSSTSVCLRLRRRRSASLMNRPGVRSRDLGRACGDAGDSIRMVDLGVDKQAGDVSPRPEIAPPALPRSMLSASP